MPERPDLTDFIARLPKAVLFSVRCFKQRGALLLPKGAAA